MYIYIYIHYIIYIYTQLYIYILEIPSIKLPQSWSHSEITAEAACHRNSKAAWDRSPQASFRSSFRCSQVSTAGLVRSISCGRDMGFKMFYHGINGPELGLNHPKSTSLWTSCPCWALHGTYLLSTCPRRSKINSSWCLEMRMYRVVLTFYAHVDIPKTTKTSCFKTDSLLHYQNLQ